MLAPNFGPLHVTPVTNCSTRQAFTIPAGLAYASLKAISSCCLFGTCCSYASEALYLRACSFMDPDVICANLLALASAAASRRLRLTKCMCKRLNLNRRVLGPTPQQDSLQAVDNIHICIWRSDMKHVCTCSCMNDADSPERGYTADVGRQRQCAHRVMRQ